MAAYQLPGNAIKSLPGFRSKQPANTFYLKAPIVNNVVISSWAFTRLKIYKYVFFFLLVTLVTFRFGNRCEISWQGQKQWALASQVLEHNEGEALFARRLSWWLVPKGIRLPCPWCAIACLVSLSMALSTLSFLEQGREGGNFAHAQCITFISQHPRNSHEWSGLMDGWLAGWIELDWMVPYQDQELRFRHMIADWLQTVVLPEVSPYVRRLQHSTLKSAHSANLVVLFRI